MRSVRPDDVDGAVKVVVARAATRLARDPSQQQPLARCAAAGYLLGRVSVGGAATATSPAPDAAAAERARALLARVSADDKRDATSELPPAARQILDAFVTRAGSADGGGPTLDGRDLQRAASVGLAVALAEAGPAQGGRSGA
jgi:hypothetical protein